MNDKFESQKETLLSIKQEISLLYQQVNYLIRNEKPLELLDLDVLMNRTHTLYDQLCSINVGDDSLDEDLPFDADDLAGLFGGMTQEEPAENTEEEPAVEEQPVAEEPQPEPQPEPQSEPINNGLPITDYERTLLRNVVAHEYGSNWVSTYEKAKVVAVVMNRVYSPKYPNTIESVLTQPDQFTGYWACSYEWSSVTQSCRDAVDYYFAHPDEFGAWLGFWGDGTYNHFY